LVLLELLDVHSPLLSPAGERLVAAEVLLLFEMGLWGNFYWEGEE